MLYIIKNNYLRTSSLPKEEPKEDESPFGKIKLKKSETVKRTWDDDKMETVDLKHHEFERPAQEEQVRKFNYRASFLSFQLCNFYSWQDKL